MQRTLEIGLFAEPSGFGQSFQDELGIDIHDRLLRQAPGLFKPGVDPGAHGQNGIRDDFGV
jgi:hypothetical protein